MDEAGLIAEIVTNVGGVGLIFLLFWRMTSKTIPALTESFKAELDEQRKDFIASMEKDRKEYQNAVNGYKEFFQQLIFREKEVNTQNVNRLASSIDNLIKVNTGVNNGYTSDR